MGAPKNNRSGNLRRRLIKTASDMISKQGLKKLTMRALSNCVGVSRTAPYRHFKNKDALLLAIAEEGFKQLTIRYRQINSDTCLDSLARLQKIGLAYIEFGIKNPGAFRLMFGRDITQHHRSEKLCADASDTFNEFLIAVKAYQDENTVSTGDASVLANYFWTTVHGLALLIIDGQIQVGGENYGLPTLLTDAKPIGAGNDQAMIDFSEQALTNFLDIIINGLAPKKALNTSRRDKE